MCWLRSNCLRRSQANTRYGKTTMQCLRETSQHYLFFTLKMSSNTSKVATFTPRSSWSKKAWFRITVLLWVAFQSSVMRTLLESSSKRTRASKVIVWVLLVNQSSCHHSSICLVTVTKQILRSSKILSMERQSKRSETYQVAPQFTIHLTILQACSFFNIMVKLETLWWDHVLQSLSK